MKRIYLLLCTLLIGAVLLTACGRSAFEEYFLAYDLLQQESSFAVSSSESSYVTMSAIGKESRSLVDIEYQVAQADGEYQLVARRTGQTWEDVTNGGEPQPLSGETYIRDGRIYSVSRAAGSEEARSSVACDPDRAFQLAVFGTIQFPEEVIASGSAENTAEGRLLTF